jgi:predicted dehydrogenase
VSWLDPYKVRQMTLVGTKKMLVYDDTHPNEKIKLFDKGIDAPPHYDSFAEFQFAYRYGDIYSPRIEEREPVRVECEHFIDCIRESKKPLSDGYSGLRVVSILEAICQSIKVDGTPVKLKKQNGIPASNSKDQSLFAPNYNIIKPVST